ncbi:Ankyrin repeat domain-containing protein 32 [Oryzias melastigma]|uniref:Ankyrin repeat domain-containing protein 32 n=1 Tax=Oryzias melastigma TaxID=30732 RepID=A0A834C4E9_ORYME|nr:Ankyrin repeat domain-containing protein 32 [Oryzias melastigma]
MERYKVFQISGVKSRETKRALVRGIQQLRGKYIGGSVYKNVVTHLIIPQVSPSEKFLAACAAGKWVVTLEYVVDSVRNGSWLPERSYEVAISTGSSAAFHPSRHWREKVATGRMTGAFQGWRVLLMVQEPGKRAMFKRLLKAGKAEVYKCPAPSYISITHVMAKPVTDNSKSHNAPCYPVSHIVQHLFQGSHLDVNFNIMKTGYLDVDLSTLEMELKRYVIKKEGRPRLCFLEFLGYHDPYRPHSQAAATDFSNVGSMIECGLFAEALDSIKSAVFPGLLPPATYLISFLQYAQQGNASPVFLRALHQFLSILIITNPPWLGLSAVKKYYIQVLQCPQCQNGLWPFLETAIRYCLSNSATCHPLPGPALPTLIHFNRDILALCLKIFQGELHCITSRGFLQGTRASPSPSSSSSSSLLYRTFWTVWERSTLLSHAVKQLAQLLIQAAMEDNAEKDENLHLADILLDLLSVLVEFWYQQHFKLNQILVDKGFKDLSEYLALMSQDVSPACFGRVSGQSSLIQVSSGDGRCHVQESLLQKRLHSGRRSSFSEEAGAFLPACSGKFSSDSQHCTPEDWTHFTQLRGRGKQLQEPGLLGERNKHREGEHPQRLAQSQRSRRNPPPQSLQEEPSGHVASDSGASWHRRKH